MNTEIVFTEFGMNIYLVLVQRILQVLRATASEFATGKAAR